MQLDKHTLNKTDGEALTTKLHTEKLKKYEQIQRI